jgi:hypothetical protein
MESTGLGCLRPGFKSVSAAIGIDHDVFIGQSLHLGYITAGETDCIESDKTIGCFTAAALGYIIKYGKERHNIYISLRQTAVLPTTQLEATRSAGSDRHD